MPVNSTSPRRRRKANNRPPKPYPAFPLYAHPSGQWAKKIRYQLMYFGAWGRRRNGKLERIPGDGWRAALDDYKAKADDLHAGRIPRPQDTGETTLGDLCNAFLTSKLREIGPNGIQQRTFNEYKTTTDRLIAEFGVGRLVSDLLPQDFEPLRAKMEKRFGPYRMVNELGRIRTVFKFAYESELLDRPMRFGPALKKPSANVLRRHRARSGKQMLSPAECRKLVKVAPLPIKAMVLLGLNCGFHNHDCATLTITAVDFKAAIIDYPRLKTGIDRRCALWPETVKAIHAAIAMRPKPKVSEAEGLVFVTTRGRPWTSRGSANPISQAVRKAMKSAGVHREGFGQKTLRHVFRTVADKTKDPHAVDLVMGHSNPTMAAVYIEQIDDDRLVAVADYVRQWLFNSQGGDAN